MKLTLRFLQKFQVIPKRSLVDENITISTKTPNTKGVKRYLLKNLKAHSFDFSQAEPEFDQQP